MNKKFKYGYDVEKYIEKALEQLKETYPWAKKEMFMKGYKYTIEKIDDEYKFVRYYIWQDGKEDKNIYDFGTEDFINLIVNDNRNSIEFANEKKRTYKVDCNGVVISGWYLERYEFNEHKLGGYSAFVQAGDRVAGGSRTFFIPDSYMKGTYEEFLDKYCELVPGYFGLGKADLINDKGLKEFLGFKK